MVFLDEAPIIAIEHEYESTLSPFYDTDLSETPTEPLVANFGSTDGLRVDSWGRTVMILQLIGYCSGYVERNI